MKTNRDKKQSDRRPPVPKKDRPDRQSEQRLKPDSERLDYLEGRNPIAEALRAGRTFNKVWVQKREGRPDPVLSRLIQQLQQKSVPILEVQRSVLDQMSQTFAHQGIIAQLAARAYIELDQLLETIGEGGRTPFLLVLDGIKDSYNLGSILRIADAAGVDGLVIPKRRAVGLDSVVAKASAGAIEYVPVCRVTNLSQTILGLKKKGFWIIGTDAAAKMDFRSADWTGPIAAVIGSESKGISANLREHCDFLVSIPLQGQVNSLNAAVATGIVVFEAVRQRNTENK